MAGIKELILKSVKQDRYQKYVELIPELKSEKSEKMVMVILTIVAFIVLGLFAIKPTLSTIASLQKQVNDSKYFEFRLEEKINNLSLLDQKYHSIIQDLPLIYDAVPATHQIATLAATIQTIATPSGINLVDLEVQNADISKNAIASKKYSSFDFTVGAQGNYQDLIDLTGNIITFQRILTLKSISIVKSTTVKQEATLQLNVSGNAYFKP